MKGLIGSLIIMFIVFLMMCLVYKKETKRNMIKDLWNDLFVK